MKRADKHRNVRKINHCKKNPYKEDNIVLHTTGFVVVDEIECFDLLKLAAKILRGKLKISCACQNIQMLRE